MYTIDKTTLRTNYNKHACILHIHVLAINNIIHVASMLFLQNIRERNSIIVNDLYKLLSRLSTPSEVVCLASNSHTELA